MGTTTLGLHPRGQRLSEELVRQFEIGLLPGDIPSQHFILLVK